MFRRRISGTVFERLRRLFWPRPGWGRVLRYWLHRLSRLPGTPYSLAAGFAVGAAVSFTPLVGMHFFVAALVAWIMRASIVASAIGTMIGNPWTFPFIWVWLYSFGHWIMRGVGADAYAAAGQPVYSEVFSNIFKAAIAGNWSHLSEIAVPVLTPMMIASVPTVLCVWLTVFWVLRPVIDRYQSRRRHGKRHLSRAKVADAGMRGVGA